MNRQSKPLTLEQARARVEALCVRAEHSTGELRRKLLLWGLSTSDADSVIEAVVATGFADDHRFARAYVHDKWRFSGWGRVKIVRGLISKRVPRDIINDALSVIEDDEYLTRAVSQAAARLRMCPDLAATYEGRTKLYRHMLSRGYEPAVAAAAVKTALSSGES